MYFSGVHTPSGVHCNRMASRLNVQVSPLYFSFGRKYLSVFPLYISPLAESICQHYHWYLSPFQFPCQFHSGGLGQLTEFNVFSKRVSNIKLFTVT